MNCAVTVLAVGDEHINEFNKNYNNFNFDHLYVLSDNIEKINKKNITKIKSDGEFNFNNKLIPIREAFNNYNSIVSLDTDITFKRDLNFDQLNDLEDGLYVHWSDKVQKYKNEKVSINQILNGETNFEELNQYGEALNECGGSLDKLLFFDEFIFLIKISNSNKKKLFTQHWENLHNLTKQKQPTDRHENKLKGALESLLISFSCSLSGIKVFQNNKIFDNLYYSMVHQSSQDINKTLI